MNTPNWSVGVGDVVPIVVEVDVDAEVDAEVEEDDGDVDGDVKVEDESEYVTWSEGFIEGNTADAVLVLVLVLVLVSLFGIIWALWLLVVVLFWLMAVLLLVWVSLLGVVPDISAVLFLPITPIPNRIPITTPTIPINPINIKNAFLALQPLF